MHVIDREYSTLPEVHTRSQPFALLLPFSGVVPAFCNPARLLYYCKQNVPDCWSRLAGCRHDLPALRKHLCRPAQERAEGAA